MRQYQRTFLLSISIGVLLALSLGMKAQTMFPANVGDKMKYTFTIDMPKVHFDGICILYYSTDGVVRGSLFNEFGISAFDFSYYPDRDKVKLHHVIKMMDKWYIRSVLRHDLRKLTHELQQGRNKYVNKKRHIKYQFTYLNDEE